MIKLRNTVLPLATAAALAASVAGAVAAPQPAGAESTPVPAKNQIAKAVAGTTADTAASPASFGARPATFSSEADYWTPERMRDAIPLDKVAAPSAAALAGTAAPVADGPAGSSAPAAAPAGREAFASYKVTRAVGKVFFKNPKDGKNYVCSASAVNSKSKQLVLTAGHCVHGGRGGKWMTNWIYVPRYHNGNQPDGQFQAKQARTFTSWIEKSDFRRDVAMVTMWPRSGKKLVNVTGGHGIYWNHSKKIKITAIGYPGNLQQGRVQMFCPATTRATAGTSTIEVRCGYKGGSSGGPWLAKYNKTSGLGFADGLTSTYAANGSGWNHSPYFDTSVKKLFEKQGSVT
ncbi:trypsin-like peptidase domain-containing protein [Streptomyces sp. NPDC097619]|uniref:trypsin-like serine peptidase n=1 Tax=Streptomyces sp. NPDC097619 TaxID=3157228 RepID=UPI0033229000